MNSLITVRDVNITVQGRAIRVARLEREKHESVDSPEAFIEDLKAHRKRIDLFTFVQHLPETQPKYRFPLEWDNLAVLPVTTYEHWLRDQIRFAPRGRVRQAEKKGVTVRELPFNDDLVKGIWEVYNECPMRQGKLSRHYGKDLQTVRRDEGTFLDRSIFAGAFLGEQMIGFIKLVQNQAGTQVRLIEIASMARYKDKCPANALIAQAVRSCADRSIQFLIYEKFAYGKKRADGLSQFKEVNGFQRVDIPRYYVPLTPIGLLALRATLHRTLADHLPLFLAHKLRDLRGAWHSWRLR